MPPHHQMQAWANQPPERWEAPVAVLESKVENQEKALGEVKESMGELMKWIRGTLLAVVMVGVVAVLNLVLKK